MKDKKERKERKVRGHKYYVVKLISYSDTEESKNDCNSSYSTSSSCSSESSSNSSCSSESSSRCSSDYDYYSCNHKDHLKSNRWSYSKGSYSRFFKR